MSMVQNKTMSLQAWGELLILGLFWGSTFFFTAIALRQLGPLTAVAFRLGFGAIILWGVVLARGLQIPKAPRIWFAFAVMGALNNMIPFSLISIGQLSVASGLAAILNATTAMFAILVAPLFFADERLSLGKTVGVAIAFAGVAIIVGPASLRDFSLASLGQTAILGAALSYALAAIWGRIKLGQLDPVVAATGMVSMAVVMLTPVALAVEGAPTLVYRPETWAALIYLGTLATAAAYLLYYRILAKAGSANLMLVTLLLPPIAIFLGTVFLGEVLGPAEMIGFLIIATGLIVIDGRVLARLVRNA